MNQLPNTHEKTGIRFGVINANHLLPEVLDEMITKGKSDYRRSMEVHAAGLREGLEALLNPILSERRIEEVIALVDELVSDNISECEHGSATYYFEDIDGVCGLFNTDHNIVTILESDRTTTCRECSPCYPHAGNLDAYDEFGVRTYCPPYDWFPDESPPATLVSAEEKEATRK